MRILRMTLVVLSSLHLLVFAVVALLRIAYPFELEWQEGGMLEHVRWILAGHHLYVKPSIEFVPYIYGPFYYYVCAMVAWIVGPSFAVLRSVSLLSTIASLALIYSFVHRETRDKIIALTAAGLFAGTYWLSGTWFDLGRVDPLHVFLLLLSFWLVRYRPSVVWQIVAGFIATLAIFTKQSGAIAIAPITIWCVLQSPRKLSSYVYAITVGVTSVLWIAIANAATDGWFNYYVLEVPRSHGIVLSALAVILERNFLIPFGAGLLLATGLFQLKIARNEKLFFLLLAAGLIVETLVTKMHEGAWKNVLIPAYAGLSIVTLLGLSGWIRSVGRPTGARVSTASIVTLLMVLQLAVLFRDPRPAIPTAEDTRLGNAAVATIRNLPGTVWAPTAPYLGERAGKGNYAQAMAVVDITKAPIDKSREFQRELDSAYSTGRAQWILTPFDVGGAPNHYVVVDSLVDLNRWLQRTGIPIPLGKLYRFEPTH